MYINLSNSTLNNLLKDYEKKKYTAELNYEKDKSAFYTSHPELSEINDKLGKLALDISKAVLKMDSELADNLKKEFYKLKKKKEDILKSSDVPQNVKEPNYECSICKDTGFIIDITGKNSLCNCIRQKMFDIDFNKSNIGNLEKENFENFNFDLYSDEINEQKYRAKISPKQNIANIKNIAVKFVENFDNPEEKNLLFTGNTGLGKTFFSNCIAKEMLSKGKTVLYQTAPIMLDNIIDDRFGKSDYTAVYKNIINVDLLIIDDLGAEVSNQYKIAELFNIINARLLTPNGRITKTIISTNLSMQNIMDTYQERIFSRLASYYNICRFFRR
jgi:DNA replication protein DnaC